MTHLAAWRRGLDALADLSDAQLAALADDIGADGGTLHQALADGIRAVADSPGRRTLVAALRISGTHPDAGELERFTAGLSDAEPWASLARALEQPEPLPDIA